ncbi:MAG: hypothetical protein KDA70_20475, partial [Planctomycetaceae bacterium]|nr:hypothetical protein [Planctomycetaceae bacterium]
MVQQEKRIYLLPRKTRTGTKISRVERVSLAEETVLIREKSFASHSEADYRSGSAACSCFMKNRRTRSPVTNVCYSLKRVYS